MAKLAFIMFQHLLSLLSINGVAAIRSGGDCTCSRWNKAARGVITHMFIFGDSFFDAGNNNYINTTTLDRADFWPYGETYFRRPTGRFSDGRLISDFIGEYANLPLIPPYLRPGRNENHEEMKNYYHGVNFASAGAGALPLTFQGMVIDLPTQLKYYERELAELRNKIGPIETAAISSSAVYMFSIGSNDYISPFLLNSTILSSYPPSHYVDMVTGNISLVLKAIYRNGGRKFVFMNLADLGCFPGLRILKNTGDEAGCGCLEEPSELATMHNRELKKMLSSMEHEFYGFKYFIYDFKTSLDQRTALPSKYGFKEGRKACCGSGDLNGVFSCGGKRMVKDFELCENPNEFIFWDSYHLTQSVYKQMADQMYVEICSLLQQHP